MIYIYIFIIIYNVIHKPEKMLSYSTPRYWMFMDVGRSTKPWPPSLAPQIFRAVLREEELVKSQARGVKIR
jgi:hypothetical protein